MKKTAYDCSKAPTVFASFDKLFTPELNHQVSTLLWVILKGDFHVKLIFDYIDLLLFRLNELSQKKAHYQFKRFISFQSK